LDTGNNCSRIFFIKKNIVVVMIEDGLFVVTTIINMIKLPVSGVHKLAFGEFKNFRWTEK
jgi:hypothetical protein